MGLKKILYMEILRSLLTPEEDSLTTSVAHLLAACSLDQEVAGRSYLILVWAIRDRALEMNFVALVLKVQDPSSTPVPLSRTLRHVTFPNRLCQSKTYVLQS